jgi:hypothetical protein
LRTIHLAALFLSASAIHAQWLNYPTPGLPKNQDGTVNLKAPAPRTADGKPDFSGMWFAEKNRPCPPDGCADMQISNEFMDIGWSLPGGLPPYQPWARKLRNERAEQNGKDDPSTSCRPVGVVKMHTSGFMRRIVQVPGTLWILTEMNAEFRQIFTDGRPFPVEMQPMPYGYSTGKWDGDTLVVESTGFTDNQWLDRNGSPMTAAAKITERFRRPNYGTMEVTVTVNDPKAYTQPWTVRLTQNLAVNTELLNYYCIENEKDAGHMVGK